MKVLLDESVPRVVKERLSHLAISTVQDMGWTGIKNGELLRRAEEQFDVFVTADQKLRHQQNLAGRKLGDRRYSDQPSSRRGGFAAGD